MCRNQRLPAHVRKFRICVAGKDIFLLKSFSKTTMEDVMKKAKISKGCLYSYYKNNYEILHDLVAYHNYNILENLRSIIDKHREFNNFDLVLNKIIDTIFAEKEIRAIFSLFLISIKNSA